MSKADYAKFDQLVFRAHELGLDAGNAFRPTPMVVGEAKSLFSTEIDRSKPTYFVADGVCGFAWVRLPKANTLFVNFLKSRKIGHKGYPKGWDIRCWDFNQSMERKEAYCSAYAKVLQEAGIECWVDSRMD